MPSTERHDHTPDQAPAAQRITLEDLAAGKASVNQYRRQEGITDPPPYCTARPTTGALLAAPCGTCGHALVLHVGVDHCPICELVDLNRQAQAGAAHVTVTIAGDTTALEAEIARVLERHERNRRSMNLRASIERRT